MGFQQFGKDFPCSCEVADLHQLPSQQVAEAVLVGFGRGVVDQPTVPRFRFQDIGAFVGGNAGQALGGPSGLRCLREVFYEGFVFLDRLGIVPQMQIVKHGQLFLSTYTRLNAIRAWVFVCLAFRLEPLGYRLFVVPLAGKFQGVVFVFPPFCSREHHVAHGHPGENQNDLDQKFSDMAKHNAALV